MSIEQRLAEATAALQEFHATTRLAGQLRARMDAAGDELAALRNRLDDEQADVDALEKPSLTRLLASLRGGSGKRGEALEKERAEAEAVRYQVAEAKERFDTVRAEHLAVRDRLARLEKAPAAYAAALEEKERYLADSGDPRGLELLANAELRGRIGGELREVRQALGAADNAHEYLSELRERITKATLMSAWNAMSGLRISAGDRQTIADLLDGIAERGVHAEEWLRSLRAELADIDEPMPELPDVSVRFPKFSVDFYVSGTPVWHTVTAAIIKAGNNTGSAIVVIDALRARLEAREAGVQARLATAERERESLHANS